MKFALGLMTSYALTDFGLYFKNLKLVQRYQAKSIMNDWNLKQLDVKNKGILYMLYKKKTTFSPPVYVVPKNSPVALPLSNGSYHTHYKFKTLGKTFESSYNILKLGEDQIIAKYYHPNNILKLEEDQIIANFENKYFRNDNDYQEFCEAYKVDPLLDYSNVVKQKNSEKNPFIPVHEIKIKFTDINPKDEIWVMISQNNDVRLFGKTNYDNFSKEVVCKCRLPLWKTNLVLMVLLVLFLLYGQYL